MTSAMPKATFPNGLTGEVGQVQCAELAKKGTTTIDKGAIAKMLGSSLLSSAVSPGFHQ